MIYSCHCVGYVGTAASLIRKLDCWSRRVHSRYVMPDQFLYVDRQPPINVTSFAGGPAGRQLLTAVRRDHAVRLFNE